MKARYGGLDNSSTRAPREKKNTRQVAALRTRTHSCRTNAEIVRTVISQNSPDPCRGRADHVAGIHVSLKNVGKSRKVGSSVEGKAVDEYGRQTGYGKGGSIHIADS